MKERWKEEITERYKTYFGDIEINVGESTIEIKERRLRRIMEWEERLQQLLRPFFSNCDPFYAYTISQGSVTKSYAIEFCLDNVSYLLTIECKKGKLTEKMYGKENGKSICNYFISLSCSNINFLWINKS